MIDEKKLIEERPEWLNPNCVGEEEYNKGWNACNKYWCNTIDRQPKVGEWIPVSERLPYDGETCLITNAESFEQYHIYKGWYNGIKGVWHMTGNFERKMNVIAWQPLPEPWKGEVNE